MTRIHLKFVYLVKLLSNRLATLSPENLEIKKTFEGWGLTLVAYKKENRIASNKKLFLRNKGSEA